MMNEIFALPCRLVRRTSSGRTTSRCRSQRFGRLPSSTRSMKGWLEDRANPDPHRRVPARERSAAVPPQRSGRISVGSASLPFWFNDLPYINSRLRWLTSLGGDFQAKLWRSQVQVSPTTQPLSFTPFIIRTGATSPDSISWKKFTGRASPECVYGASQIARDTRPAVLGGRPF